LETTGPSSFLQHHLIPLQKNIYNEWPRQSYSLFGRFNPLEGYRYSNAEETAFYFKIPKRIISDWWKARDNCEGTRWTWYTLVQGHKQFILDQ
jgi:hypothetical protein